MAAELTNHCTRTFYSLRPLNSCEWSVIQIWMERDIIVTEIELIESLYDMDLSGLDSEYTYSTRALVSSFKADGAHLNRWWVMTPVTWKCPCCERSKAQIVRLNKHSYLTCQLHEHHDHMKDVVKALFEDFSTKQNIVVADELSEKFAIKTAFSLSAYDNTVICFDCNNADAMAKKIVNAHKYFSFSPKQISEFLIVNSNEDHKIDPAKAQEVWQEAEPVFKVRMEMAKTFALIAAEKKDWYQPSNPTARRIETVAKFHFERHGITRISKFEPERLLYNTELFKGENCSWRVKVNPEVRQRPNKKQLEHLASTRGKYWNRYDSDWTCPCCTRSKLICVRPSKKNPWVLEIKSAPMFVLTTSEVDHQADAVCADCLDTAINLGREVVKETSVDIYFPSSVISVKELSEIIVVRSHSKHNHLNDRINKLMPVLIKRAKSIETEEKAKHEAMLKEAERIRVLRQTV